MKKILLAFAVAAVALLAYQWLSGPAEHPHDRADATLVNIDAGELVGFLDRRGSHAWMGIPFAAPPVRNQRWRAPLPPAPWQGVREVLTAGNLCPQYASQLSGGGEETDGGIAGNEDCLYLNVWAPAGGTDLPVMLWLHGGGNSIGHGGSYSGDHLATAENVVVVTINYRLGPLGWFSHPALATGDPLDDSGNYGSLDVVRALQWTQDNIAAFGGNPANVTLFGESAGAADTLAMMASPLAAGLFHRAIVQSGGYRPTPVDEARNFSDATRPGHAFSAREVVNQLLVNDGSAADRAAAKAQQQDMATTALRDYLYAKTAADILAVYDGGGFGMINFPALIADGHVLPSGTAADVFGDPDGYNAVPVILGTNRDEAALFMVRSPEYVENRFGIFPRLKDPIAYANEVRYSSLAWKARGVDDLARLLHANQPGRVYAYRFDWDEEPSVMGYDLSQALGAAHGLEIAFAFGEFTGGMGLGYLYPETPQRDALARSMMGYWAEFARSGAPLRGGDEEAPLWSPWGHDELRMMVLDSPADAGLGMSGEEVSAAGIKQQLAADTTVGNLQRCRLYARMFGGGENWDAAEYAGFGPGGCSAYPAAEFAF